MRSLFLYLSLTFCLLTSCYQQESQTSDAWNLTEQQVDSISFYTTHHYTQNFNFFVKRDSLPLIVQHPTEVLNGFSVDTVSVAKGDRLVVADIVTMPADSVDTVWVKVARDQQTIGWAHESVLLKQVAPDTPISRFIDTFSDTHILIFLAIVVVVVAAYMLMLLMRRKARIVHFNDIDSFYPSALVLLVATSAVFYSTIQLFAPDSWRHFYYHPTLNPFAVPFHLGMFLLSVWALVIVALAAVDDVRRHLPLGEAIVYLLGLAGVCAVNYVVFSLSTLIYVGYPLLVFYVVATIYHYYSHSRHHYLCGHCGATLHEKGRCPHCGVVNE